jgi:uracil-DNA glycosylase family 4
MFIGEAPGRLGADDSNLPFHGDKAGHNFEKLLDQVGLTRYDAFVTNAVLCNPKDPSGNNATPTAAEIENCSEHLLEQIRIVNPKIVVTLGAVALRATESIQPHQLSLRNAVRTSREWAGRKLIPLYHPGQRAMIHRSFANQLSDYQFIAEQLRRLGKRARKVSGAPGGERAAKVAAVVRRILQKQPRISYFALHKLLFLAEARAFEQTGERMTRAYIIRQKDGPYCVELHPAKLRTLLPELRLTRTGTELLIAATPQLSLLDSTSLGLTVHELSVVDYVVERYAHLSHANLKRASYLVRPMRDILRRERNAKENLFNAPLFAD